MTQQCYKPSTFSCDAPALSMEAPVLLNVLLAIVPPIGGRERIDA